MERWVFSVVTGIGTSRGDFTMYAERSQLTRGPCMREYARAGATRRDPACSELAPHAKRRSTPEGAHVWARNLIFLSYQALSYALWTGFVAQSRVGFSALFCNYIVVYSLLYGCTGGPSSSPV